MQEVRDDAKPFLSIVIACYNDAQYIDQAVSSAVNQTYSNKEVIVVDDGSNIETKTVLAKLKGNITKLITQENQGQSKARNAGILEAKGDFILTLDSDDYFEPTFCEKAIKIILNNKNIKLVTCQANLIYEDGSNDIFIPNGGSVVNFLRANEALSSALFKKGDWEVCGGYDESMRSGFEDWDFFLTLLKSGGESVVIQEPLYNYRKRNHSTTSKANKIKYELLEYIYNKHRELYINHFDLLISYLLSKIQREEKEKIKNTERIDFKIGKAVLRPLRWIKAVLK